MEKIKEGGDSLAHFGSFFFVVQVKGSKRLAHSQGRSLQGSSKEALEKFRRTFTGLDWNYMMNREEGELICDVGITVQPSFDEKPLVGLWRLDCLEASYGAGGYHSGNIHTINTLSMYGGLQAESPPWRRKRTQISFRSSYNLAYEAIRQPDNSRNLFEEKEVYNRSPWFQLQLEKVSEIYKSKASTQSYGVRDEFRISGKGISNLMECVDSSVCFHFKLMIKKTDLRLKQVTELQDTNPMLWLPSDLWFSFLNRRLAILNHVHEKIYLKQPPNYGVLSGLFAYLMQSVIFTPPVVNTYIRESLTALQYHRNCEVFGMFFLDNLEVENRSCMIKGILEEDDAMVKGILGPLVRKPRFALHKRQDYEESDDDRTFPLGPRPTWNAIRRSVESDPTILVPRWEGLPEEIRVYSESCEDGSTLQSAGEIFRKFTQQMWMSLHEGWRITPGFQISPQSVEEALKNWTVDFILEHCVEPTFRACAMTGLQHVTGKHVASFAERKQIYFPSADKRSKEKGNFWTCFSQEPGFLHLYWEKIENLNEEERLDLQGHLEELLEHCQCLPDSARSNSTNRGWNIHQKRLVILTNPKHYRIQGVGEATKGKGLPKELRSAPAHRSEKERTVRMLQQEGHTRENASGAVNARQRIRKMMKKRGTRSNRAKNKRLPPKMRGKSDVTQSSRREREGINMEEEVTSNGDDRQTSNGDDRQTSNGDESIDGDNVSSDWSGIN